MKNFKIIKLMLSLMIPFLLTGCLAQLISCDIKPKGCLVQHRNALAKAINEGESVLISPVYGPEEYGKYKVWKRVDKDKQSDLKQMLSNERYHTHLIDNGAYTIIGSKSSIQTYKTTSKNRPSREKNLTSTLGNIKIAKVTKREIEKFSRHVSIVDYYETLYHHNETILSINIQPKEVVLTPAALIDVVPVYNACRRTDAKGIKEENGAGNKESSTVDSINFLFTLMSIGVGATEAVRTSDVRKIRDHHIPYNPEKEDNKDTEIWTWDCPIEAIEVYIRKDSIEEFIFDRHIVEYPDGVIEKVVYREFEKGKMLENIEPEILEDGLVERYTINAILEKTAIKNEEELAIERK